MRAQSADPEPCDSPSNQTCASYHGGSASNTLSLYRFFLSHTHTHTRSTLSPIHNLFNRDTHTHTHICSHINTHISHTKTRHKNKSEKQNHQNTFLLVINMGWGREEMKGVRKQRAILILLQNNTGLINTCSL